MSEGPEYTTVLGDRFELPGYYGGANIFIKSPVTLSGLPNHSPGSTPAVQRVFISSTIDDLVEYRRAVSEAVRRVHGTTFLFEEDNGMAAFANSVEIWQTSLQEAQGYIGLCGHWYGLLATNSDVSLPHMAFRWALRRWQGQSTPPLTLYSPEPDSAADQALRERAKPMLPKDAAELQKHTSRLTCFHSEIARTIGFPKQFTDERQLHDQVLVTYAYWRGATPLAAAGGAAGVVDQAGIPPAEREQLLGRLGRGMHLSLADAALSQAAARADVPAVVLLITGDRLACQKAFLTALLRRPGFRRGRQAKPERPHLDQYDLDALVQWAATALGHPAAPTVTTPEQLADWVHVQLQTQQLCFVLDQSHRLVGGVTTFHNRFWQPLYRRLSELRGNNPLTHRLVAVVVSYGSEMSFSQTSIVQAAAPNVDFSKLQLLPSLGAISSADVISWLRDDLRLPDVPLGRQAEIAALVLQDDTGNDDGTPTLVFTRLQREDIWRQGDDDA